MNNVPTLTYCLFYFLNATDLNLYRITFAAPSFWPFNFKVNIHFSYWFGTQLGSQSPSTSVSYFSISQYLHNCQHTVLCWWCWWHHFLREYAEKQAGQENYAKYHFTGEIIGENQAYEKQLFAHVRWSLLSQRSW